jgi:hypothetical protein
MASGMDGPGPCSNREKRLFGFWDSRPVTFAKWIGIGIGISIAIGFRYLHSIANPDCDIDSDTERTYPFIAFRSATTRLSRWLR